MKTARFFHYVNGAACKLALRAGESLHHHTFAQTDEGFSSEACRFSYDGRLVTLETYGRGRDCDGLVEHFSTAICPVSDLRAGYVEPDSLVQYPAWKQTESAQRDHSAEAMNY